MASADEKNFDDINVTPMVDLYLVLLLIFIIMTTASVQGVKVNLPSASKASSPKLDAPKTQAITVGAEGRIQLNATPVTLRSVGRRGVWVGGGCECGVRVRGGEVAMGLRDVVGGA
jgi:biopolymer transport protein ExbD